MDTTAQDQTAVLACSCGDHPINVVPRQTGQAENRGYRGAFGCFAGSTHNVVQEGVSSEHLIAALILLEIIAAKLRQTLPRYASLLLEKVPHLDLVWRAAVLTVTVM